MTPLLQPTLTLRRTPRVPLRKEYFAICSKCELQSSGRKWWVAASHQASFQQLGNGMAATMPTPSLQR
ncbi:MAG TPA: hypothetical protein PKA88_26540, partial [Polyangiaceae bacterium]|nr:hypothetical protein [Polyangiaceae bacterium]